MGSKESERKLYIFNRTLETIILVLALMGFFGIYFPKNPSLIAVIFLYFVMQVFRYLNKKYDWEVKEWVFTFAVLVLLLHLLGEMIFYFFYIFPYYDKFLHYFFPLAITYILLTTKILTKHKWLWVFIVMGGVAVFEVAEFIVDQFANGNLQGVVDVGIESKNLFKDAHAQFSDSTYLLDRNIDTMYDATYGLLGSWTAYIIFRLKEVFSKKKKQPEN